VSSAASSESTRPEYQHAVQGLCSPRLQGPPLGSEIVVLGIPSSARIARKGCSELRGTARKVFAFFSFTRNVLRDECRLRGEALPDTRENSPPRRQRRLSKARLTQWQSADGVALQPEVRTKGSKEALPHLESGAGNQSPGATFAGLPRPASSLRCSCRKRPS